MKSLSTFRLGASVIIITLSFAFCNSPQKDAIPLVSRDTTVTVENSYSKIFIDSVLVENFMKQHNILDTTAQRIRNFYNKRNYSYAWFTDTGFTVQGQAFWSAHDNGSQVAGDSSHLHERMDHLMTAMNDSTKPRLSPDSLALAELQLTAHFFRFMQATYGRRMKPGQMEWNIPVKQQDLDDMLDSLLTGRSEWKPANRYFQRMYNAIQRYRNIQQQGGFDSIYKVSKPLREGDKHVAITQIKKRLAKMNGYPSADTTNVFNDSLVAYISNLRQSYGLNDGKIIDSFLVKQLNVSADQRLKQMLINLERFKWLPEEPSKYILVNIPDYSLYILEDQKPVSKIKVVVGKAANKTVVFSGDLKHVVFSPYWNVPPSIVKNEMMPAMAKSKNYLARNNLEITGQSGALPVIRQKPGPDNALGQVKFLFPNEYNIYLHDTNAKGLFERDNRAFSHGCIRVHQPANLAKYLLKEDSTWTNDALKKAMNATQEKWVNLRNPVKVFILYVTSWVDSQGNVHFRNDIYGHDKNMSKVLFD